MTINAEPGTGLAIKIMMMIIGALFVVMTSIGGFTASHLISDVDEMNSRLTNVQTQLAASEVARADQSARLSRIEGLLDDVKVRERSRQ